MDMPKNWRVEWNEADHLWELWAPIGVLVRRFGSLEQLELYMQVQGLVK